VYIAQGAIYTPQDETSANGFSTRVGILQRLQGILQVTSRHSQLTLQPTSTYLVLPQLSPVGHTQQPFQGTLGSYKVADLRMSTTQLVESYGLVRCKVQLAGNPIDILENPNCIA
jgi:hypothetical protein